MPSESFMCDGGTYTIIGDLESGYRTEVQDEDGEPLFSLPGLQGRELVEAVIAIRNGPTPVRDDHPVWENIAARPGFRTDRLMVVGGTLYRETAIAGAGEGWPDHVSITFAPHGEKGVEALHKRLFSAAHLLKRAAAVVYARGEPRSALDDIIDEAAKQGFVLPRKP